MTHDRNMRWPLGRRLRHDARGMSFVFVALGMMSFLGATMLAVDVGMLMTARGQAQNSADAGALAGAVAIVYDDFNDRSAGGPIVQSALGIARSNAVMHADISVEPADVTFPAAPNPNAARVRVQVYRAAARGNPVSTLVATYFGVTSVDIAAAATAEASPANAATCIKPWAVPDKWDERQTPAFDGTDTFDALDNQGNPIANPDIYYPATHAGYTGYQTGSDYGRQVTLKPGNPNQAYSASHFYPIALSPNTGAAWYEQNIPGCWPGVAEIGNLIPVEPGNMMGPTVSGTQMLIDMDPTAYWSTSENGVMNSSYHPSPRIVVLPVFDPMHYEEGRQHGRLDIKVANLIGFFIENLQGTDVVGRIVPMTGLIRDGGGAVPNSAFLRAIRLVE